MSKRRSIRFAILLLFAVILSAVAGISFSSAAERGVSMSVDGGQWVNYTNMDSFISALDKCTNKTVDIVMHDDIYGKRIKIPSGSKVTIEMDGYDINRELSDDVSDGEVIFIDYNASLTLEGGPQRYGHIVNVYVNTNGDVEKKAIYGGLITGGYSRNGGGGIHMKSNCTLIANDVTIAGNYAEDWVTDGYGGGICVYGNNSKIILNNSSICNNFCKEDGGGIFFDEGNCSVEMKESHIDYNYAEDDAGGIDLDGNRNVVKGDGKSTVSHNEAKDEFAGGIWAYGENCIISGVEIGYNYSDHNGGGIYQTADGLSVSDCYIHENRTDYGGGMYIASDTATLKDSTIIHNRGAEDFSGVYVVDGAEGLSLSGKLIIKDNDRGSDVNRTTRDLFIPLSSKFTAALTEGADVRFDKGAKQQITVLSPSKGNYSDRYLTCNDSNYVVYYNRDGSVIKEAVRCLLLVDKNKYPGVIQKDPTKQKVNPYDTDLIDVSVKEYDLAEYEVIKGYISYPSFISAYYDNTAEFYYSDGYFKDEPEQYNEHLATLSMNMAMAGSYLNRGGKTSYDRKHGAIRQFMADIGCEDEDIYVNEFNTEKPGTDTIGVTIGSKPLMKKDDSENMVETGKILVPVAVRGVGYESEWASNVTLGKGDELNGEAQGFAEAAEIVFSEINKYVEKHGLKEEAEKGNVKFWVTGFSRAGATANLTSRRLIDKYNPGNVYGYDFATPQGGVQRAMKYRDDQEKYFGIHNIVDYSDLVPLVGPTEMGFQRYGVDHFAPGKALTSDEIIREEKTVSRGYKSSDGSVNDNLVVLFRDNTPIHAGSGEYNDYVKRMLPFLYSIDPGLPYDDYFRQATIDYIPFGINERVYRASDEPKWTQPAEFERFFISELQDWVVQSREDYVTAGKFGRFNDSAENKSIQEALREAVKLVFGHSDEALGNMSISAMKFKDELPYISRYGDLDMYTIFREIIQTWESRVPDDRKYYANQIWEGLEKNGTFDELTPSEKEEMKKVWPTLADMLFTALTIDYNENWQDAFGTFAYNTGTIMSPHTPERYLAWLRTEDSFYTGEDVPYEIDKDKAETPELTATAECLDKPSDPVELQVGRDKTNRLKGNQIIRLGASNIHGEIIYYTLKNKTTGVESKRTVYRDGIELPCNKDEATRYEITVEAYSYEKEVVDAVYNISVADYGHIVTISSLDKDGNKKIIDRVCREGDTTVVSAEDSTDKYFTGWVVTDEEEKDVTDIIFPETDSRNASVAEVTLPEGGNDESGLSAYYDLTFEAQYSDKISEIIIDNKAIKKDSVLYKENTAHMKAGSSSSDYKLQNIMWTYMLNIDDAGAITGYGGYTLEDDADNEYAYSNVIYIASATIPADRVNGIVFKNEMTVRMQSGMEGSSCSYIIDSSTGDLEINVRYPATEEGEHDPGGDDNTSIQIKYYDMNRDTYLSGSDTNFTETGKIVLITAKVQENMKFVKWTLPDGMKLEDGSSIENRSILFAPQEGDKSLELTANYVPVIKQIDIAMNAPEKNMQLPNSINSLRIKTTNDYYLDPKCFNVSWSPEENDGFASCDTVYTATVTLKDGAERIGLVNAEGKMIDEDGQVTEDKGEQATIKCNFGYADNVNLTVTGEGEATLDKDAGTLYCTFPKTAEAGPALLKIYKVADISGVPFGTDVETIRGMLPETLEIQTEDCSVSEANVTWNNEPTMISEDEEEGAAVVYEFNGTVSLPEGVTNPRNIELNTSIKVHVNEAEALEPPVSNPISGTTHLDKAVIVLSGQDGVNIYYTMDGTPPGINNGRLYDGEIVLEGKAGQSSTDYTIRAIAAKEGYRKSEEAVFKYTVSKILDRPESEGTFTYDGSSQLILEGSDYYTIEPESGSDVRIDEFGNAFAKDAGEYKLTISLKEGFFWNNDSEELSTEYITVTRTVNKAKSQITLKSATLRADGTPKSIPKAEVSGSSGQVTYTYYTDANCTKKISADSVIKKGKYYVKASVDSDNNYLGAESNVAVLTLKEKPILLAVSKAYKKKAVKLTWNKQDDATKYVIYGQKCGKKYKKIKTTGKTSFVVKKINGKKLKAHKSYKFYVVAYSGTQELVKSKSLHVITAQTCGKRANITKITAKSSNVRMAVGKKIKVRAVSKVYKGKKHITTTHSPVYRYVSDCEAVAAVDSKGNVTALAPGTAIIYIIDTGGKYCKTVITVK